MRIGILTHYYNSINYGGMLQAYALARYLNQREYESEQICYRFSTKPFLAPEMSAKKKNSLQSTNALLKLCKRACRSARYRLVDKPREKYYADYKNSVIPKRAERFAAFQSMVPHSLVSYDPETVSEAVEKYDCLITGSDQVWNFSWFNPAFFLDFPNHQVRRVAYAASAGKSAFVEKEQQYLRRVLSEFHAVSVRETDLADKLNSLFGKEVAEQTIDPTLLLTKEEWDEIASRRLISEKYLFCYFLHNDRYLSKLAKQFARTHHLRIATIPFPGVEYNVSDIGFGKYRFDDADPSDFLSLIKNAEYVLTDSFHATVFSLLFEKEFVSFPRGDARGMDSRLSTLTDMFGCSDRFCRADPSDRSAYMDALPPIRVDLRKFGSVKEQSEAFLARSLHGG